METPRIPYIYMVYCIPEMPGIQSPYTKVARYTKRFIGIQVYSVLETFIVYRILYSIHLKSWVQVYRH